ncbi:hypothetical protein Cva_01483 [Caedimonas varicaedens]|uniref:Outer membrane protein beta-barrel domain-containing protein n=1 Tax=Caedimonas varicaedens TaxID=1629334 RepID=A0A0K8MFZ2_9PROT|nr:hypothetical protein Cva_01483 [Caedimonas varicaedens]
MRYKLKMLLATSALALSSAYGAQEQAQAFKHQFNLGLEVEHYHYKEPETQYIEDEGWEWMESKAWMAGVNGSYRLTWQEKLFVQPEARILWGKENYKTGDGDKYRLGIEFKVPNLIFEPRFIGGGHINVAERWTLSPYFGIGYRLKIDDGEKVLYPDGTYDPYRKSNYVYVPLGTYVHYKISDTWSVSAKGEYDYLIKGWQYSRGYKRNPVEYNQKSGYGLKGEVAISYAYSDQLSLSLAPYIHYWNIKKSNEVKVTDYFNHLNYMGEEPKNSTIESGLRLEITF